MIGLTDLWGHQVTIWSVVVALLIGVLSVVARLAVNEGRFWLGTTAIFSMVVLTVGFGLVYYGVVA